jgi:hypothetical protein
LVLGDIDLRLEDINDREDILVDKSLENLKGYIRKRPYPRFKTIVALFAFGFGRIKKRLIKYVSLK